MDVRLAQICHFRVPKALTFKTSPVQILFGEIEFHLHENKKSFS